MSADIRQFPGGIVSREQQSELHALETSMLEAISKAKEIGVPQGLIVALLHAHAMKQTNLMIYGETA